MAPPLAISIAHRQARLGKGGLSVLRCELFAGRSRYKESSLVVLFSGSVMLELYTYTPPNSNTFSQCALEATGKIQFMEAQPVP